MRAVHVPPNLNRLLSGFLAGDVDAQRAFAWAAGKYLDFLTQRHAPFLPPDVRREVVSQVFAVLLRTRPRFDPLRSSAARFLVYFVRIAAREVAAGYTPAGQRTRIGRGEERRGLYALDEEDVMNIAAVNDGLAVVEARDQIAALLPAGTAADLVAALVRVYGDGECISDVAKDARVSRSTLSRRLAGVVGAMRAAV